MKYILALMSLLTLTACFDDDRPSQDSTSGRSYMIECIDGIQYWLRSGSTQGFMAVRVDPETMTFVRCETGDNQ